MNDSRQPAAPVIDRAAERPRGGDRRQTTWHALWTGNFQRRRRSARRVHDRNLTSLDWHHPQWLALTILILLLSSADAILTLTLIGVGGSELNPAMQSLVGGSGHSFAFWKLGLTSAGVVTLVLLARIRAFGRLHVGQVLYLVALLYVALIGYELWLLKVRAGVDLFAVLSSGI
jgi:hypothetical protein